MSKGNQNTEGNKKYNFPFQFNVLQVLGAIASSTAGAATEVTLQQVLAAIQDGQDFETKVVVDDGGNGTVYLEVRIWNPDTQTWEAPLYYLPGSNTGLPAGSLVAPIVYLNNSTVLANIYAELQAIDNKIIVDDDDNVIAEGQTLPLSIVELYGAWDGAWQRLTTDGNNRLVIAADSLPLPNDAATETTLYYLATPLSGIATSMLRATTPGTVSAGKRRVSFFNAGNADANVLGAILKAGESVTFSSDGVRDTLTSISYNPLTSELLITTVG